VAEPACASAASCCLLPGALSFLLSIIFDAFAKANYAARLSRQRFRGNFLNPTLLEPKHPVTSAGESEIVGGDEGRQLMIAMQPRDQLEDRFRCAGIEISGGLVGQQDFRLSDERSGQGDALLFTARKLSGPVMRTLFQAYFAQPFRRFLAGILPSITSQEKRHRHILERGKLRQQVMELPNEADFPIAKSSRVIF
jgi:hypothetical protein